MPRGGTDRGIDVLLVDDHEEDLPTVQAALDDEPFRVHHADSLSVALQRLDDSDDIDVVLVRLDVGIEHDLDLLADRTRVPIIAVTPVGEPEPALRALRYGAREQLSADELTRPLLTRTIRYALERHRLEQEVERLAHVDPLTGLHNRRYLTKHLDAAVAAARRHGHPLTLCICDVDDFKQVNDRHGHLTGDTVLQAVATVLAGGLRTEDAVARFGGDEFCLLLPHIGVSEARVALERIRRQLAGLRVPSPTGVRLRVSVTFGVAQLGHEHADAQALFRAADAALYRGKAAGRGRLATA